MTSRGYIAGTAVVVATFAVGWVAAVAFQSPEQRAASASAPPPRAVVAPVTLGRLADQITARADITRRSRDAIAPSALPDGATVTSVTSRRGATIDAGDVPVTVNGRPLFVLPGSFDFYRELAPGTEGLDVRQLQEGLRRAGHAVSELELGTFGAGTEQAISSMYAAAGFDPALREREPVAQTSSGPRATPPPPPPPMVVMPITEVAVVPRLPAVLGELPSVGAAVAQDQPLAVLETGALVARVSVVVQAAVRLEPGMPVDLTTDDGDTARGTIAAVSTAAGDGGGGDSPVVLVAPKRPLPPQWDGKNVLARITIAAKSKETLIVPTLAVATGSDGEAAVFKERADGSFVRVPVRELSTLAGRSAIELLEPGSLAPGDNVRVG